MLLELGVLLGILPDLLGFTGILSNTIGETVGNISQTTGNVIGNTTTTFTDFSDFLGRDYYFSRCYSYMHHVFFFR